MVRSTMRYKKTHLPASEFKSVDIRNTKDTPKRTEAEPLEKRSERRKKRQLAETTCFSCRQVGHAASNCPSRTDQSTTVCYGCGSKEHTLKECRGFRKDGVMKYATCYVCKEVGHLSSQCPKNENGLYPNGGACKFCGLKNHLARECPSRRNEKREEEFMLETITAEGGGDDDLSVPIEAKKVTAVKKPKKKVVKF